MNLRKEAAGRFCQIRLAGCLTAPVCLCHFRLIGISGMGMKSPDQIGAWGCSHCHAIVDSSKDPQIQLDFAHGVFRTQAQLIKEEKIK